MVAPMLKYSLRHLMILGLIGTGIAALFFLCTLFFCSFTEDPAWCFWWPHFSLPDVIAFIRSSGNLGIFASIGIMIIHSFVPFPAEFLAIANGMVYGSFWGTIITWVGAMSGAFLAFALTRKLGQPFVRKMVPKKKAQTVDQWVARHGVETLFISRFIPVISFNLVNYAAGLTKISWMTFAWTTGAGILPMTILMVVMGDQIHTLPWSVWILLFLGGFLLLLFFHLFRRKQMP